MMTTITLKMHDWEVRHLCQACASAIELRKPATLVEKVGVSTSMAGLYCGNCGTHVGDLKLVPARIYVVALGTPRPATAKELDRFTSLMARLKAAHAKGHDRRFLKVADYIAGLLIPRRHSCRDLTHDQWFRLLPADLATYIDELGG